MCVCLKKEALLHHIVTICISSISSRSEISLTIVSCLFMHHLVYCNLSTFCPVSHFDSRIKDKSKPPSQKVDLYLNYEWKSPGENFKGSEIRGPTFQTRCSYTFPHSQLPFAKDIWKEPQRKAYKTGLKEIILLICLQAVPYHTHNDVFLKESQCGH